MTKNEFEKTARWAIVENRKTGKRYEVKAKQESQFVFSDETKGNYKDYIVCREQTEPFGSLYTYDYLRDRWIFDCKLYEENGKWYNLWNHNYVRDVTEHEREKMDSLTIQVGKP